MATPSNPQVVTKTVVTVKGRVVDQLCQPILNLEVRGMYSPPGCDNPQDKFRTEACTLQDGCYELTFPAVEPSGTVCVLFPRTHEQPDGCVLVLTRGYRVDVEACESDVTIPDRSYESTACMLYGAVEREVVDCDDRRREHEPFENVSVQIVDREGCVVGTVNTNAAGEFCLPMPKESPLYLRFPQELTVDGQSWCLEAPEREVLTSCCRPFVLGDPVRYELCRARITGVITDGKYGLPGFPIKLLHPCEDHCADTTTDADGCYRFDRVAPGSVRLVFRGAYCDPKQKEWELADPNQAVQSFPVKGGDLIHATPVKYGPEMHTILCNVTLPDGTVAANRVVRVLDEHGKEVTVATTGPDGSVTINTGRRGRFKVTVYPDAASADVPYSQTVNVNSCKTVNFVVPEVLSAEIQAATAFQAATKGIAEAAGSRLGEVGEAVIDSSTYPVLTEPVSFPYPTGGGAGGGTPGGTGAAARGAGLGPMVEGAIRDVLGWRPKPGDPKGFVAALTQSFTCLDVEGHTECKWNERSYAAQVTTDMGAVTGAQASIYARAKVAIDQSLPLVQGLYPLSPTILQEDIDSIRALVVRELTLLGAELGIVGGPRVQRVDELFRLLLDVKTGPLHIDRALVRNPDLVGGHIGELGRRLWLRRGFINTIQDEQNYTNFLIVIDYVEGLKQSWETYRPYFARSPGAEPFFGTQLVLLSRALTAIGEAVEEVSFAMDSVFLGPAERQTIELHFRDRQVSIPWVPGSPHDKKPKPPLNRYTYTFDHDAAPLFIAELLDWTALLPSESAPMLDDSGKDGLIAVFTNVDRLRKLVHASKMQSYHGAQLPGQPLPAGYKTPRVQRALGELADALDEAAKLAGQIKGPEAFARRELQDLTVVDTLQDAMQDPALRSHLATALGQIIQLAAMNNGKSPEPTTGGGPRNDRNSRA
jgi:hypothetical protein